MNAPIDNGTLDIDRERVTCLLLINSILIKKALHIYQNVLSNQQSLQQIPQQTRQSILESYQNYTRRVHCNLSVLSYIHEKYHGKSIQPSGNQNKTTFPIIMSAPQDMPELHQLYAKLQGLYPEALQFLRSKIQQMRKQTQFQQPNPNSPIPQQAPPHSQQVNSMSSNSSVGATPIQGQHSQGNQNVMNSGNFMQQKVPNNFNPSNTVPFLDIAPQDQAPIQAKHQMQTTMSPQQILSQVNGGGGDSGHMNHSINANSNVNPNNANNSSNSGMMGFF